MSLRHAGFTALLKAKSRWTSVLFYPEKQGLPPEPDALGQERASAKGGSRGRAEAAWEREPATELSDGQCPQRRPPPGKCMSPAGLLRAQPGPTLPTGSLASPWWAPIKANACSSHVQM